MEQVFVGIDVAKDHLDVHSRPAGESFVVSRDGEGLAGLVDRLRQMKPALIVSEATGGFEVAVAAAIASAGLPIAVVNPRQIRDFARATGKLAKTDALDAAAIAHFAEAVRPEPRPLAEGKAVELGELIARRRQVIEMMVAERNRGRLLQSARLKKRIERHIAALQKELTDIETDLDENIRNTPIWRENEDLLKSVPVSAMSQRALCWPICPNLAPSAAKRSLHWLVSLHSTVTAGHCGASAPFGADVRLYAPPFTWQRLWRAEATRPLLNFTGVCAGWESHRKWRSRPACANCWLCSTPFCATASLGGRPALPFEILSEPQLGRTHTKECDRDRRRKDDAILLVSSEGAPNVKALDS